MTETLEQIKKTIAEAHEQGIYNWNTATISALITTIESLQIERDRQAKEIKRLQWAASNAFDKLSQMQSEDVSEAKEFLYKALTESTAGNKGEEQKRICVCEDIKCSCGKKQ